MKGGEVDENGESDKKGESGENGRSGNNLPRFGKYSSWMAKGASWRGAILTKMGYLTKMALVWQLPWVSRIFKLHDFDENGECGENGENLPAMAKMKALTNFH